MDQRDSSSDDDENPQTQGAGDVKSKGKNNSKFSSFVNTPWQMIPNYDPDNEYATISAK